MRENLVIVRAGDSSLHPDWFAKNVDRNFDLFVSYYGNKEAQFHDFGEYHDSTAGLKWPSMAQLFSQRHDLLFKYETCWFPDDDLLTDVETINRMFELFKAYDLWLAQPALATGSYLSHGITAAVPENRLRFTNFVEIMCPLFSRHALGILGPSFSASISGWGLDFLWPHLLGYPTNRIAILDETRVVHTRPFKTGPFYERCAELGVNPWAEVQKIVDTYGVAAWQMSVHSSVLKAKPQ